MLTILNPHIDDFLAEPLSYRLVGRRPLKKYEYLLHEPVKRFGFVEVLGGTLSSVIPCKLFCRLPNDYGIYVVRFIFGRRSMDWPVRL